MSPARLSPDDNRDEARDTIIYTVITTKIQPTPTMSAAGQPTTYEELFSDPARDPSAPETAAGYDEIFARWRVDNNPPTATTLHTDVLTDFDSTVGAIGYFVKDPHSESGILKVAHGFRKFAGLPGRPTPHRGETFGFVSDVVAGTDIESFHLDESQFSIVAETRCANTPERHMELFTEEPDEDVIDPIDSTSQAQQMIKTRRSMFIPFCLVEYVIGKELSAREAFEVLWPVILQQNMRETAKPLIKFLMVAATKHTARSPPRTVNQTLGYGIIGAADVISDRRRRVLYQHLPALMPAANATNNSGVAPHMDALVSQLSQLNDHARLDRVARQQATADAAKPKSIRDKFGDYVTDRLLKLTDSAIDDDLPKVYHELAARTKGMNKRLLLQQSMDLTARELGLNKLTASSTHVIDLDNWDFVGTSYDAIGSGLLPFSIVPPEAPSRPGRKALLEDQERARLYDLSGEAVSGAISSGDAKKLYNSKGYIPTEWTEATIQIEEYAVMLGTLLGAKHKAVTHYVGAVKLYDRIKTRLQAAMNRKYGVKLAPALLILYFQLNVRSWLEERWEYDMLDSDSPDLITGMRTYLRSNRFDWLPHHEDIAALSSLNNPTPTAPPSGSNQTPAPAPAPRPRAPDAVTPPPMANRRQNPNRDPRYVGNTPLAINVRTRSIRNAIAAAGTDPPMVTRGGLQMPTCLSWHVKGSCSDDCQRRADHGDNTNEEAEALHNWCVPAFA